MYTGEVNMNNMAWHALVCVVDNKCLKALETLNLTLGVFLRCHNIQKQLNKQTNKVKIKEISYPKKNRNMTVPQQLDDPLPFRLYTQSSYIGFNGQGTV